MSALRRSLSDYLAMRRELGYKLDRAGQLLSQFVDFCDQSDTEVVTVEAALTWATLPEGCSPGWGAFRLCVIRGFARYLHGLDPRTGVPPTDLLPTNYGRARPFLYSTDQLKALLEAAQQIPSALRAASTEAIVGLLASTGMRIGEALALDRSSVDLGHSRLTIQQAKFNKSREVALHPTTVDALAAYATRRDKLSPRAGESAFFVSATGTRVLYCNFHLAFQDLVRRAGIEARSPSCRPRPHDLRHTFAVTTVTRWYREGADVAALLPSLSTYLGHVDPAATYWYLSGSPELLGLAARRLEATYEVET
ncbi:MAG: tyrosine-type recombinase/integrase [Acidimicrobiales bacterium]